MFGTYRVALALLVVAQHIGGFTVMGVFAVFGFYILSGYLMTLIMHESYGYSRAGAGRFALNRFLKIYPMYWLSVAISVALVLYIGEDSSYAFQKSMVLPRDLEELFMHVFIVFPPQNVPILTPPAWALTVELFFYAYIGLGLSKSRRLTLLWFLASVLYHVYLNVSGRPWQDMYYPIAAASLPFSMGALLYHHRDRLVAILDASFGRGVRFVPLALFLLTLLNWAICFKLRLVGPFLYSNICLQALMVVALCRASSLPLVSKSLDTQLGRYSYPLYLLHFQLALITIVAASWFGFRIVRPHPFLALISIPSLFFASWLFVKFVDLPIESIKHRVKARR